MRLLQIIFVAGCSAALALPDQPPSGGVPVLQTKGFGCHLLFWSKDGNSLAVLDHESSGPASHLAEARVQDLRSDKTIAKRRWQWDRETKKGGPPGQVWRDASALAQNSGCSVLAKQGLLAFEQDGPLQAEVRFQKGKSMNLVLRQEGKAKTIYRRSLENESEFDRTHSVKIRGYLRGPNPHRIAVVVERKSAGPDGEVRTNCLIVGAGVNLLF